MRTVDLNVNCLLEFDFLLFSLRMMIFLLPVNTLFTKASALWSCL